jgi:hypothetical protein
MPFWHMSTVISLPALNLYNLLSSHYHMYLVVMSVLYTFFDISSSGLFKGTDGRSFTSSHAKASFFLDFQVS